MVKASTIRASLLENRVFDQSIVGIFPKDLSRLYYVLALMNSDVVNELIHTINPTANNSANYVKQIPYVEPDDETLAVINEKVGRIIEGYKHGDISEVDSLHKEINKMIREIYSERLKMTA